MVSEGSPAFRADLLRGDIIVSVDGQAVYGTSGIWDLIRVRRGKTVHLEIVDEAETMTKDVPVEE